MIWEKGNGKRVRVNSILFPFSLSPLTELYWGTGDWGLGNEGDEGETAITNYQLPITNYQLPITPCPMPHAPCPKYYYVFIKSNL
ncbi:hypothetical protein FDUTEX481_07775 [Tolypothrix sp. PCC 7601]|nr:hypothetical protein FDUTEX481_07775 [Tolypothrix sp. PCC 7601]